MARRTSIGPGPFLQVVGSPPADDPAAAVMTEMLDGWRRQQLSRGLHPRTVTANERVVQRFQAHLNEWPWRWTPAMLEEWISDLRSVHGIAWSTVRSYQAVIRRFCWYLTDPAYDWIDRCERAFGTHPTQICHDLNARLHLDEVEPRPTKRAFTLDELQRFLDHADERVQVARSQARKGWLNAFRDAALFKLAYAWGLRRNETRMLDVTDFGVNPRAPEFGRYGVCYVRHGKAGRGAPPKRRSVLTVWDWAPEVVTEWINDYRPCYRRDGPALFPSERSERIDLSQINRTFATYRDTLGLDPALDFHSLRRSYVTHLIEAGFDALFVQQQVGHEHASTTSIYTCVSSDYRTSALRAALDRTLSQLPSLAGRS
jgi:site-specific recombinase XerD